MGYSITQIGKIPSINGLKKQINRAVMPLKFSYLGGGAENWDKFRGKIGSEVKVGQREQRVLKLALSKMPASDVPFNLIHIGVGNGIEIPTIFSYADFKKSIYVGVDISRNLIENTIKYQYRYLKEAASAFFFLSDVEKAGNLQKICKQAKKMGKSVNLLLISGEGTLCANQSFLRYVVKSLGNNDRALIALEGYNYKKRREILETYNSTQARDLFGATFKRLGIKGKLLPAEFNEKLYKVRVYFESNRGKKILCLESYKPSSKMQFREYLKASGLRPLSMISVEREHTFAAFCSLES